MRFFKAALSLAFLAGSALAQGTQLTIPSPGSTLTAGSEFVVQVYMGVSMRVVMMHLLPTCVPRATPKTLTSLP